MTPPLSISPATEADFPILAHIAATAMSVDLVHRIIYPGNNPFDTSRQERSVMAELRRTASNPVGHIYKAMLQSESEIVGYAMFRFEDGGRDDGARAVPKFASDVNARFLGDMMGRVREAHGRCLDGVRHIWWTHLMVLPQFQRQGIGSALFRYGLEYLAADEVPIWLVTQMRGRAMYLTLGFQDVEVIDVDLSEYAGPWLGFGVQRNVCMLRRPGGGAGEKMGE